MRVGSTTHKELFCKTFIDSYQEFEPESLDWPELNAADIEKIRAVPFWQEVLYTEMRAINIIDAFSATITDPQIRQVIELMGHEERRHERLVKHLIARYGIVIEPLTLTPLPKDIETTFIDFGFGECVDSFLGFGFFKIAQESRYLPEPLFKILDILMQEEIRHVLLIINWMAYREAQKGRRSALLRAITSAWYYGRAIRSLVGVASRNADQQGDGQQFSATQASDILGGLTIRTVIQACLSENQRRLACFDALLLKPTLLPSLAKIVMFVLNPFSTKAVPKSAI